MYIFLIIEFKYLFLYRNLLYKYVCVSVCKRVSLPHTDKHIYYVCVCVCLQACEREKQEYMYK